MAVNGMGLLDDTMLLQSDDWEEVGSTLVAHVAVYNRSRWTTA